MVNKRDYKEYGNWTKIDGKIEDVQKDIEDVKTLLYENARDTLSDSGIDIEDQHIEWVVQQAYHDGRGFVPSDHLLAEPVVVIAWKTKVKNDE